MSSARRGAGGVWQRVRTRPGAELWGTRGRARLAAERKVLELKVTERELGERAASEQEVAKRQRALQPWK